MRDIPPPETGPPRMDQLLFAGLAGLSVAVVLQLIDKEPSLDHLLGLGLLCFAVALPFLVSSFLLEVARPGVGKSNKRMLFDLLGVVLAVVGFGLLFYHLHLGAGLSFTGAVAFCLTFVVRSFRP